jgi:hypothetical protein
VTRRTGYVLGIIELCQERDIDPKRPRRRWCLYSKKKPGKVLGRHLSRRAALKQERAIQIRKRGG